MDLKKSYDKGDRSTRTRESRYFEYHISKAVKEGDKRGGPSTVNCGGGIKEGARPPFLVSGAPTRLIGWVGAPLIAQRSTVLATDFGSDDFRRLEYTRYADDWVIGIRGPVRDAKKILKRVSDFCAGLEVSEKKTKITSLSSDKALFLGTLIRRSSHRNFKRIGTSKQQRRIKLGLRFEAPVARIKKKLKESSFIKGDKSFPKFS